MDIGNWKHGLRNKLHCRWYIKGFPPESFCLHAFLDDKKFKISLGAYCTNDVFKKILDLLQKEEYKVAKLGGWDEEKNIKDENNHRFVEYCNFVINDDEIDNTERLAWYAHYEPECLLKKVTEKINKYIKDEEITEIITKINREVFGQ